MAAQPRPLLTTPPSWKPSSPNPHLVCVCASSPNTTGTSCSLNDADGEAEFTALDDAERDIVLHIVAATTDVRAAISPQTKIFDIRRFTRKVGLTCNGRPLPFCPPPGSIALAAGASHGWNPFSAHADYAASGGVAAPGGADQRKRLQDAGFRTPP